MYGTHVNHHNTEAEKMAQVAEIQYNQRIMEKKKQKEISQVNSEGGYQTLVPHTSVFAISTTTLCIV